MQINFKELVVLVCIFSVILQLHSQAYLVTNGITQNSINKQINVANNPAYPIGSGGPFTCFSLMPVNSTTFQFGTCLDTGVRVFLVSPNDTISLQPILMNSYPELTSPHTYTFADASFFYLGLYTGGSLPQNGIYNDPLFGWAKLANIGGAIQLFDSALEYGGQGIIVGTQNIIVPEPNTIALLSIGGLLLGWRRWRNSSH
jgi:hypothetical protein